MQEAAFNFQMVFSHQLRSVLSIITLYSGSYPVQMSADSTPKDYCRKYIFSPLSTENIIIPVEIYVLF